MPHSPSSPFSPDRGAWAIGGRRQIWTRKLLYPGHTLPTALGPVLVGAALAWHDGVFAPVPALLALMAGWLIQFAGVVTDNYENLRREPDDREHPELVAAVASGLLTLAVLRTTIAASYGLALVAGLYLTLVAGWPVVLIGLASIAASLVYSAGPWPVGRHGLADPLFFLFFGVVSVMGTYYVQAATVVGTGDWSQVLSRNAFALGLPIGALITNILIIDDIRDREFDLVKGKRTVAVRYGVAWSRAEFVVLLIAAYVLLIWLWLSREFGPTVLLPLLTLPPAIALARYVGTHDRPSDLVPMTPRAAQLMLGYSVLLAAGLVLSGA